MLPVSCFGEEGPSGWHEALGCLPGTAAVTPQPPFQASQVMDSKELFTKQSRLQHITREQANSTCFSMSNSKLTSLKTKEEDYKHGMRTLEGATLRETHGSWQETTCR